MDTVRGKVFCDGLLLLGPVLALVQGGHPPGEAPWAGSFLLGRGTPVAVGGRYRLETDDGGAGDVEVVGITDSPAWGRWAKFVGR
jgi:hypothetical protein